LTKIFRENLNNQVYNLLKKKIVHFRFSPGLRINVEEIAREMGVSRTPVWEAIRRLEQEGLLKCVPKKGVFLREADKNTIRELYTVRSVLEKYAGRIAAKVRTEEQLKSLKENLIEQEKVIVKKDLYKYSLLDLEFHLSIASMSANQTLKELLKNLIFKARAMRIEPILFDLYFDHIKVFEAITSRKSRQAGEILFKHNRKVMREAIRNVIEGGENKKEIRSDLEE